MSVIEIHGLHKQYRKLRGGRTVALDNLDLTVDAGGVFGFLGPNGSGKTTTIRCLLGLSRPTSGTCRLLGVETTSGKLSDALRRVGAIVETPAMFPNFSARRNLRLLAGTQGIRRPKVDEVLEVVGLGARSGDLVKTYSLGMKQRLGIAAALLKDPELLILDEPANGLDPAGIREVRQLLRRLGGEGRTVFVSSHILSEVQQTCDQVAILAKGRCVTSGPVREVLAQGRAGSMLVRVAEPDRAAAALTAAGLPATVLDGSRTVNAETADVHASDRDGSLRVDVDPELGARISEVLASHGLYLSELRPTDVDLETVFLQLTGDDEAAA